MTRTFHVLGGEEEKRHLMTTKSVIEEILPCSYEGKTEEDMDGVRGLFGPYMKRSGQ